MAWFVAEYLTCVDRSSWNRTHRHYWLYLILIEVMWQCQQLVKISNARRVSIVPLLSPSYIYKIVNTLKCESWSHYEIDEIELKRRSAWGEACLNEHWPCGTCGCVKCTELQSYRAGAETLTRSLALSKPVSETMHAATFQAAPKVTWLS